MNPRWQPVPDSAPYRCSLTFQDQPADGPFLRTGIPLFPVVVDEQGNRGPGRREETLWLSPQAIREACQLPGSPLVAVEREVFHALGEHAARLELEIHQMATELAEAREELDRFRKYQAAPLEVEALVATLDARYQLRRGPKPKAEA